jgi:hypothetical protein
LLSWPLIERITYRVGAFCSARWRPEVIAITSGRCNSYRRRHTPSASMSGRLSPCGVQHPLAKRGERSGLGGGARYAQVVAAPGRHRQWQPRGDAAFGQFALEQARCDAGFRDW